jgi:hypothetical protein
VCSPSAYEQAAFHAHQTDSAGAIWKSTRILHWGDHDEGGFRIAARVAHFARETGRRLEPWCMDASQWNDIGDEAQAEQHRSMIRSAARAGWGEQASTVKAIILEQEALPITLP